jgi:hypothetical protein
MGRWLLSFSVRSPSSPGDGFWTVGIQESKFRLMQQNGHSVKLARILLVKYTLENPRFIIEGWCRPDKDDCLVYAGKPTVDYRSASIECPPPPNMLFLVFVLPDGTIDDWTWRPVNDQDPEMPEGLNGKVLWQQT